MTSPEVRRGPLDDDTAAQVRRLAAAAESVDGVAPLSEQPLLHLTAAAPTVHLLARGSDGAREGDGALDGYAQLDLDAPGTASAELVVAPGARRRGLGRLLLDGARTHAVEDRTGDPAGRRFTVWAHGDLPPARALASGAGLSVVRELWRMGVDLTALPADGERRPPRGIEIRTFEVGRDEEPWRRVNARAFAGHPEQGRISRADLDARIAEPWFDPAGFLLAERDGVLLGSVWTKVHPARGDEDAVGEIYVVGVDPDAQGLGLGGALTWRGLEHLRGLGLRRAMLYTEGDNEVAIRAYSRAGFGRTGVDVQFG
ncbi:mycothiol synthase [Cellulomonas fimi]|uniref:Mycothiol acetyltransferase n=1 Tax=Cellulomonas fimi TaxID=1708 RepID=A0A7Y0QG58_CELFI|nr:mycothiol synthase [Cellulomonas fimi]NMR19771.1 mycothiol synthase [Cellulomonas fimi]